MQWVRLIRHLRYGTSHVRRRFSAQDLRDIEHAIVEAESHHRAEIRFCVEASLDPHEILRGVQTRERAEELFSTLRVWDTAGNNGVLLYLLLADNAFEIVADRGLTERVSQSEWEQLRQNIEQKFKGGAFREGVILGIQGISTLVRIHCPDNGPSTDSLPNEPVVLR